MERAGGLRWYACSTRARAEKRVERLLRESGVEAFLPLTTLERQWADRRKKVDFPLFPGYVFGRFRLSGIQRVLSVPGVATVIRQGDRPAPIDDGEIENIRRLAGGLARSGQGAEPERLRSGERVTVLEGPFREMEGVVLEVRGRKRILVGLSMLGQGLSIDVDGASLGPIAGVAAAT